MPSLLSSFVLLTLNSFFELRSFELYRYIFSRPDFVDDLFAHIYDPSVCLFIQKNLIRHQNYTDPAPDSQQPNILPEIEEQCSKIFFRILDLAENDEPNAIPILIACCDCPGLSSEFLKKTFFSEKCLKSLFSLSIRQDTKSKNEKKIERKQEIFKLIELLLKVETETFKEDEEKQSKELRDGLVSIAQQTEAILQTAEIEKMLSTNGLTQPKLGVKKIQFLSLLSSAVEANKVPEHILTVVIRPLIVS